MKASSQFANPGEVIGKYSITRVIGSGGMGVVYEAMHVRLGQRVALKVLLSELTQFSDIMVRFEREARTAVRLHSPHATRVFDVDTLPDGTPYIVMELLEGRDLAADLVARGPLPIADAVEYVRQACDAMAEAHMLGTVHRDLKPGNLFLATNGSRSIVKVLDFGISKVESEGSVPSVTTTRSTLGTALYMSPEQVRSAKNVDARTDVWSLGVVLYELLTGSPPFAGDTATAVAAAIVSDDPLDLHVLRPDVPAELERVVMKALQKDRDQRFPDAGELGEALGTMHPSQQDRSQHAPTTPTLLSPGVGKPVPRPGAPLGPVSIRGAGSRVGGLKDQRSLWVLGGCAAAMLIATAAVVREAMRPPADASSPPEIARSSPAAILSGAVLLERERQPVAPTSSAAEEAPSFVAEPNRLVYVEAGASAVADVSTNRLTKPTKPASGANHAGKMPLSSSVQGAPKPPPKNTVDLPDNPG